MNTLHRDRVEPPRDSAERPRAIPHLVFEVDSQPYACPVAHLQRLMRLIDAKTSPPTDNVPAWETGRLLADGAEIPIISLRQLWGLPPIAHDAQHRQALLLLKNREGRVAFVVDSCRCVLPQLPRQARLFELPAPLKGVRGATFKAAVPWSGGLLITVDLLAPVESQPSLVETT